MLNTTSHHFTIKSILLYVVLLTAIVIGIIYVKKPQELRKKAARSGAVLSMNPATTKQPAGATFTVGIILSAGDDSVSAVELHMRYDPQLLEIKGFETGKQLPVVLSPTKFESGFISVTLGAQPKIYLKGTDIIGTLSVKSLTDKPATITFTENSNVAAIEKPTNTLVSSTGIAINGETSTQCTGHNNGAVCSIRICPDMPPCPGGTACTQVIPDCVSINGTCHNGTCNPTPTPSPPTGCYYKQVECFKAPCDLILVCPTPTPTGTPTPTPTSKPTPTGTPRPTPTPTSTPFHSQTMTFKVKLTGVSDAQAEGAKINVKFYKSDSSIVQLSSPLILTHVGSGMYQTSAVLTNPFPAGTEFRISLKGEKHLSVRFCRQVGQTVPCADGEFITVPNPVPLNYGFDLTGILLPPGDLGTQDGRADQSDIDKIKNLMTKPSSTLTAQDKLTGDLNYDGVINGFDLFLILQTLRTRYDG